MRAVRVLVVALLLGGCRPPPPPSETTVEIRKYHEALPEEVQAAAASPALGVLFTTAGYRIYRFHRNMRNELSSDEYTVDTAYRFSCEAAEQLDEFIRAIGDMVDRGEIVAPGRAVKLSGAEADHVRIYQDAKRRELEHYQTDCAVARRRSPGH